MMYMLDLQYVRVFVKNMHTVHSTVHAIHFFFELITYTYMFFMKDHTKLNRITEIVSRDIIHAADYIFHSVSLHFSG